MWLLCSDAVDLELLDSFVMLQSERTTEGSLYQWEKTNPTSDAPQLGYGCGWFTFLTKFTHPSPTR